MMDEPEASHGGQLRAIAKDLGISVSRLIDFSVNINPDGYPESIRSVLHAAIDEGASLTTYPDIEEVELRQSIARLLGIDMHSVAVANGFVPLLELFLRELGIRNCVLPVPCFSEYRRALERAGIAVTARFLSSDSVFKYDVDDLLANEVDAILIANPQNPSGAACTLQELVQLTQRAAEQNTYVLLDEAFIDYLPGASLAACTGTFPNLVVFRSVTKFYAIPGLRIAYAVADPRLIRRIQSSLPPWSISTLASLGARTALHDAGYARRSVALNDRRRLYLADGLLSLGWKTYPGAANFLLARMPGNGSALHLRMRLIRHHRMVIRDCSGFEGLTPQHTRIAVLKETDIDALLAALKFELC